MPNRNRELNIHCVCALSFAGFPAKQKKRPTFHVSGFLHASLVAGMMRFFRSAISISSQGRSRDWHSVNVSLLCPQALSLVLGPAIGGNPKQGSSLPLISAPHSPALLMRTLL